MSTLTVWKFQSAEGAEEVETTLKSLQKEGLIRILDAAVVSRPTRPSRRPSSCSTWSARAP
ncbi:hypothetical protein AB0N06_31525 [Streptomyces sp. NPDC051020]|uniref:hypothetical protein n=1 Tax=Streptomyces sp. NPDC051020 TaxID=3155409 RepID=UPI00341ED500